MNTNIGGALIVGVPAAGIATLGSMFANPRERKQMLAGATAATAAGWFVGGKAKSWSQLITWAVILAVVLVVVHTVMIKMKDRRRAELGSE